MLANQTMKGNNNLENLLFPLPDMYMTQIEGGDYSHKGSYAMDFQGWQNGKRLLHAPYYAPCTLKLLYKSSTDASYIYESVEKVNFIDGSVDYVTIYFGHDDNTNRFNVGDVVNQGSLIGMTGSSGQATGDHVHIELAKGKYSGRIQNDYGVWIFVNQYHIYNAMGVNNTIITQGFNYNWRIFENGSYTPPIIPHVAPYDFLLFDTYRKRWLN